MLLASFWCFWYFCESKRLSELSGKMYWLVLDTVMFRYSHADHWLDRDNLEDLRLNMRWLQPGLQVL
jgi:hypothetical protein